MGGKWLTRRARVGGVCFAYCICIACVLHPSLHAVGCVCGGPKWVRKMLATPPATAKSVTAKFRQESVGHEYFLWRIKAVTAGMVKTACAEPRLWAKYRYCTAVKAKMGRNGRGGDGICRPCDPALAAQRSEMARRGLFCANHHRARRWPRHCGCGTGVGRWAGRCQITACTRAGGCAAR